MEVGDRITFRSPTRWADRTVTRVVKAIQADHPVVRYGGYGEFIVRPHEVREVIPAPGPFHPIAGDTRYSVALEWTGTPMPRPVGLKPGQAYVFRWCGDFVSAHDTRADAFGACVNHKNGRS